MKFFVISINTRKTSLLYTEFRFKNYQMHSAISIEWEEKKNGQMPAPIMLNSMNQINRCCAWIRTKRKGKNGKTPAAVVVVDHLTALGHDSHVTAHLKYINKNNKNEPMLSIYFGANWRHHTRNIHFCRCQQMCVSVFSLVRLSALFILDLDLLCRQKFRWIALKFSSLVTHTKSPF